MSPHPRGANAAALDGDLKLASFNQNFETFRSLNSLMWQIPLIAMTLTGGLWFGVSTVGKEPAFRTGLLSLAGLGNLGLMAILHRLRYIMGQYLEWLEQAYPAGHVSAPGVGFFSRNRRVKQIFQAMLLFAAVISFVLIFAGMTSAKPKRPPVPSAAVWYDEHAEQLADDYESIDATAAHPELFQMAGGTARLQILDIGSGTGRDAAALAELGHSVTAVDPSGKMLRLARALHPAAEVKWENDELPALIRQKGPFDLIVLSAVWMHVPPAERPKAFARLAALLKPGGRLYATLRTGPDDLSRGMYAVDSAEFRRLSERAGMGFEDKGVKLDLLGRKDVSWLTVIVTK